MLIFLIVKAFYNLQIQVNCRANACFCYKQVQKHFIDSALIKSSRMSPGWPDWATYRQLGDCVLWAVYYKLQKQPKLLGYFFAWKTFCVNLDKKWIGRLIWSPWMSRRSGALPIFIRGIPQNWQHKEVDGEHSLAENSWRSVERNLILRKRRKLKLKFFFF
jgi:hypothetical protein